MSPIIQVRPSASSGPPKTCYWGVLHTLFWAESGDCWLLCAGWKHTILECAAWDMYVLSKSRPSLPGIGSVLVRASPYQVCQSTVFAE
jgi:hypothetical protein